MIAVAAAPLLLSEADLHAGIVYFGHTEQVIDLLSLSDVWNWRLPSHMGSGSGSAYFSPRPDSPNYVHFRGSADDRLRLASFVAFIFPKNEGELIDSQLFFGRGVYFRSPESPNYYGFRIEKEPGSYYYGWVEMSSSMGDSTLTIHRWAIEDEAGTAIEVGAVPEAADFALGLGALAAGASTVLRKRRNKQSA